MEISYFIAVSIYHSGTQSKVLQYNSTVFFKGRCYGTRNTVQTKNINTVQLFQKVAGCTKEWLISKNTNMI